MIADQKDAVDAEINKNNRTGEHIMENIMDIIVDNNGRDVKALSWIMKDSDEVSKLKIEIECLQHDDKKQIVLGLLKNITALQIDIEKRKDAIRYMLWYAELLGISKQLSKSIVKVKVEQFKETERRYAKEALGRYDEVELIENIDGGNE